MLQAGVAIVERDPPIESLVDMHFGAGEAEATVVVGDELAEHGVGGVDVGSLGEPQFAGEATLEHTPETRP